MLSSGCCGCACLPLTGVFVRACVCIHIVRNTGLHGENLRSKELRSLRHVISTGVEPVHGMCLVGHCAAAGQRALMPLAHV